MKKFVIKGMMPRESIEEKMKRLTEAVLPGVHHAMLHLHYDGLRDEKAAYCASLFLTLSDGGNCRMVNASSASFDEALDKIQGYEACLIAGKSTAGFSVYEGKSQETRMLEASDPRAPFETRAEFTTWVNVLCKHERVDKKGEIIDEPRTVGDLPKLSHGMAVVVPLKTKEGNTRWYVDWFDYACYKKDSKDIRFVCIQNGYDGVFPLDPYITDALNNGRPVPKAYTLWLKKTTGDIKHELKNKDEYR